MNILKRAILRYRTNQKWNRIDRINKQIDRLMEQGHEQEAEELAKAAEPLTTQLIESVKKAASKT